MSSLNPRFLSFFAILIFITVQNVSASQAGLVNGELIPASKVSFQVVDGFAFQNYLKIYIKGLHVGNYIGPVGTKANTYKKIAKDLEHKARINGGNFYFDKKGRKMHGEEVIEKIVHFPMAKSIDEAVYDLASCQQELRDLENRASMIFQESLRATEPLEKLIHHMKSRNPAKVTDPSP